MNVDTGSPAALQRKSGVLIVISLANLKRSIAALRRRRINLQPVGLGRMTAG